MTSVLHMILVYIYINFLAVIVTSSPSSPVSITIESINLPHFTGGGSYSDDRDVSLKSDDSHWEDQSQHGNNIKRDTINSDNIVDDNEGDNEKLGLQNSQPLKTLQTLRKLLEETDYVTATPNNSKNTTNEIMDGRKKSFKSPSLITDSSSLPNNYNVKGNNKQLNQTTEQKDDGEGITESKLWTSKDRSKYKKQQRQSGFYKQQQQKKQLKQRLLWEAEERFRLKQQVEKEEKESREREQRLLETEYLDNERHWHQHQQQPNPLEQTMPLSSDQLETLPLPQHQGLSDEEDDFGTTDGTESTDEYSLPNLPIYLSDAESTDDDGIDGDIEVEVKDDILEVNNTTPSVESIDTNDAINSKPSSQSQPMQVGLTRQQKQQLPPPQQGTGPPYEYLIPPRSYSESQKPAQSYPSQQKSLPHQQHSYNYAPFYSPNSSGNSQIPPSQLHQHFQPWAVQAAYQQQQREQQEQRQRQQNHHYHRQQQVQQQLQQQQPQSHQQRQPQSNPLPQSQQQSQQQSHQNSHQHQHHRQQQIQQGHALTPSLHQFPNYYRPSSPPPPSQFANSVTTNGFIPHTSLIFPKGNNVQGYRNPLSYNDDVASGSNAAGSNRFTEENSLNNANDNSEIGAGEMKGNGSKVEEYTSAPILGKDEAVTLAEAGTQITMDSLQKIAMVMIVIVLLCYCAVSPRTLPLVDYNVRFKENIRIVSTVFIVPVFTSLLVFDARENDVNSVIGTFYSSFTMGYFLCVLLEIVSTTLLRMATFLIYEQSIFNLLPNVPFFVLPWTLKEHRYRPKRITLFAADIVTSCVSSPIIEEYIKLKLVQWSVSLPRNFCKRKDRGKHNKVATKNKKRKKDVMEPIVRSSHESDVTNINSYVTSFLAVSLGLKLCDSIRRILMYTKKSNANKAFYALCRGGYPIHELCGIMTALQLAKRDVLGVHVPIWRMLAPAVFFHAMANFRGMKPIFKWNSSTPWSEMQLSPWNVADNSTLIQILSKGLTQLIWLSILGRVLGYCIKNYYLIGRQAKKRTTKHAGIFSAELAAAEMLKKAKKKDKK